LPFKFDGLDITFDDVVKCDVNIAQRGNRRFFRFNNGEYCEFRRDLGAVLDWFNWEMLIQLQVLDLESTAFHKDASKEISERESGVPLPSHRCVSIVGRADIGPNVRLCTNGRLHVQIGHSQLACMYDQRHLLWGSILLKRHDGTFTLSLGDEVCDVNNAFIDAEPVNNDSWTVGAQNSPNVSMNVSVSITWARSPNEAAHSSEGNISPELDALRLAADAYAKTADLTDPLRIGLLELGLVDIF